MRRTRAQRGGVEQHGYSEALRRLEVLVGGLQREHGQLRAGLDEAEAGVGGQLVGREHRDVERVIASGKTGHDVTGEAQRALRSARTGLAASACTW